MTELEVENKELKHIIEQMTNDVKRMKAVRDSGEILGVGGDIVIQEKQNDEDHTKTIYELRRELFRL